MFNDDCNWKIVGALSLYQEVLKELVDGTITLAHLKFLLSEKQQFLDSFKVVAPHVDSKAVPVSGIQGIGKAEVLLKILQARERESEEYERKAKLSNWLCYWCNQLQLNGK